MPKIDDYGNAEFHPAELPIDYHCGAEPENPFTRKKEPEIALRMKCTCGNEFILHVEYDLENPLHNLCDDCILALPPEEDQQYPIRFRQTEMEAGEPIGGDE